MSYAESILPEADRCFLLPTIPEGHRLRASIIRTDVDQIEESDFTNGLKIDCSWVHFLGAQGPDAVATRHRGTGIAP